MKLPSYIPIHNFIYASYTSASNTLFFIRYAFIKFSNAEDAIQAYKEKYNLVIDSRSVVLRFRRGKGNVNPPGQVDKLVSFYLLNEKLLILKIT